MWQHSQICCHGMPQAVVLGTKRDRGLSCRGATLRGPGEQRCFAKREKSSQGFHAHPFLSRPLLPPFGSHRHQQSALTTNHDTRVCTHTHTRIALYRYWRAIRGVLGDVSLTVSPCLSPPSVSSAYSGPRPAPQSAQDHIWSTAAQGTLSLPMNARTVARTNNTDPEGGSLIYPSIQCFSAFVFCGAHRLEGSGQKPAATGLIFTLR